MGSVVRFLAHGDAALLVEFGEKIRDDISGRVLALDRRIANRRLDGFIESVPTYRSLLIHYDPLQTTFDKMRTSVREALAEAGDEMFETNRNWMVPVVYGGEAGIDIDWLAAQHRMDRHTLIALHSNGTYRVCMIGFMPGFAYLSGLDPSVATPRRKEPRPHAPQGTISIGGEQTAVQSVAGPSGWHWIGRTPLKVYDPDRTPICLFEPGDTIRFVPIAEEMWDEEAQKCELAIHGTDR